MVWSKDTPWDRERQSRNTRARSQSTNHVEPPTPPRTQSLEPEAEEEGLGPPVDEVSEGTRGTPDVEPEPSATADEDTWVRWFANQPP